MLDICTDNSLVLANGHQNERKADHISYDVSKITLLSFEEETLIGVLCLEMPSYH